MHGLNLSFHSKESFSSDEKQEHHEPVSDLILLNLEQLLATPKKLYEILHT